MKDLTKRFADRDVLVMGLYPTENGNPVDDHNFLDRPWKRMLRKGGPPP